MSEKKTPLWSDLESMADDIQIGGDACFRSMSLIAVNPNKYGVTPQHLKDMKRLLRRAENLLTALHDFWHTYPELDEVMDRGSVLASDRRASIEDTTCTKD